MELNKISNGELFQPGVTSYEEGAKYSYGRGGHELLVFYESPTKREIASIEKGVATFRFLYRDEVIWMLAKFGGLPWIEAPYSGHLNPSGPTAPSDEPTEKSRVLFQVVLIDAATGIVKRQRVVTWSPEFTIAIQAAIRAQAAAPWEGEASHDRKIAEVQSNFDTEDLVKMSEHETEGGA